MSTTASSSNIISTTTSSTTAIASYQTSSNSLFCHSNSESEDMDKVLTSYFDKTVNSSTIKVCINYIIL